MLRFLRLQRYKKSGFGDVPFYDNSSLLDDDTVVMGSQKAMMWSLYIIYNVVMDCGRML